MSRHNPRYGAGYCVCREWYHPSLLQTQLRSSKRLKRIDRLQLSPQLQPPSRIAKLLRRTLLTPTTVTNLITMGFSALLFAPAVIGFIAETYSLTINMYALCIIVFFAGNIFLRKFRVN